MNNKLFSVIMPTFNSEKTIRMALDSIVNQSVGIENIEILVIDGGSTDHTKTIAKEYNAIISDNNQVQQEYAKHIGLVNASGKYLVYLDSDEILSNPDSFKIRLIIFNDNPDVKMILFGGYIKPKSSHLINDYINIFSDPFAHFMYNLPAQFRVFSESLKNKFFVLKEEDNYIIFDFSKSKRLPLIDLCASFCFEKNYFNKLINQKINSFNIIPQLFYLLVKINPFVGVIKNDGIVHYSSDTLLKFVNKIKWRVIVNIHYKEIPGTGFSNREHYQPTLFRLKKYLFIPYAFIIIFPLLESIYATVKYKNFIFLIHWLLTLYTAMQITWNYLLKIVHIKPVLPIYGHATKGKE